MSRTRHLTSRKPGSGGLNETFDSYSAAGVAERPKLDILGCLALLNNSGDPGVPWNILTTRPGTTSNGTPRSGTHTDDLKGHIDSMIKLRLIIPPVQDKDGLGYVNLDGVNPDVKEVLLERFVRNNMFQEIFQDCLWRLQVCITTFGIKNVHLVCSLFQAYNEYRFKWNDTSTALYCARMLRDVIE